MIFSAWRDTSSFCSRHTFVRGIDSQETVPASSVVHPAALLVSEAVISASTTRDVSELPRTDDSTMEVRHNETDVPLPEVTELDLQRALNDDFRPTTPREGEAVRPTKTPPPPEEKDEAANSQKVSAETCSEVSPQFLACLPRFVKTCQNPTASCAIKEGWFLRSSVFGWVLIVLFYT